MEFWNHLQMQLEHKGFCRVENKKNWYWQEENPVLYLICLLDGAEEGWREENMTFADFAGKMEGSVEEFHCTRVVALSVLVDNQEGILPVDSVETAFQTYDNKLYRVFWHFSPETGRLSAAQGQPTQLLGVEKLLRAAAAGREPEVLVLRDTKEQKTPVATAVIFVICAALLAWCMLSGQREEILSAYGLSREGILAGEYYRFYLYVPPCRTAPSGIQQHLFVLFRRAGGTPSGYGKISGAVSGFGALRRRVQRAVQWQCRRFHRRIGGNLWSAWRNAPAHQKARRTVYGYELFHHASSGGNGDWFGFLQEGVDNFAHIGGFLGGIAVFSCFCAKNEQSWTSYG